MAESLLAVLEDGDSAEHGVRIVVAEDSCVREFGDRGLQVGKRASAAATEFVRGDVVAGL